MYGANLAGISGEEMAEYIKNKMDEFERHSRSQNNGATGLRRSAL